MKNWAKRGRGLGHVTYFWILGPLLSLDRVKLQTSSFAAGSMVKNTKQKIYNWAQKRRGLGHVTYFWILGTPIISGPDGATNAKFCSQIEGEEY